ncbi:hypothetical protein TRVL_04369 [Trypanosoma vivax]|nr:hypothetical protein TRVL_04369 [Trypanosoma vivax]
MRPCAMRAMLNAFLALSLALVSASVSTMGRKWVSCVPKVFCYCPPTWCSRIPLRPCRCFSSSAEMLSLSTSCFRDPHARPWLLYVYTREQAAPESPAGHPHCLSRPPVSLDRHTATSCPCSCLLSSCLGGSPARALQSLSIPLHLTQRPAPCPVHKLL